MLKGAGRRAEKFFTYFFVFKKPWKYQFPAPWFCLHKERSAPGLELTGSPSGRTSLQNMTEFLIGDCLLRGPVLDRTGESQNYPWTIQSLWPFSYFSPGLCRGSCVSSHTFFSQAPFKFDLFCSHSSQPHLFPFLAPCSVPASYIFSPCPYLPSFPYSPLPLSLSKIAHKSPSRSSALSYI